MKEKDFQHVVYLSGIIDKDSLSANSFSCRFLGHKLSQEAYPLTTLKTDIIIGFGSASFETIRDLVEKLPHINTPNWRKMKLQPMGFDNVLDCFIKTIDNGKTFNRNFNILVPENMTYKELLLEFRKARNLKRFILNVSLMTPKLFSYWLYFVNSTYFKFAFALVDSIKAENLCRKPEIFKIINIKPIRHQKVLKKTLSKIVGNRYSSSGKDSPISSALNVNISEFLDVPTFGCFRDKRTQRISNKQECIDRIWRIGGKVGWYYANTLWNLRGFIDKLFGGVGLRRGRIQEDKLCAGDTIDCWRVLYANNEEGRLLLFSEMKLPGEAWLEFKVKYNRLEQTATFRPNGIWGRIYWYAVFPFHDFIFKGMLNNLAK